MKTEVRVVTPAIAKELLKRNPNNRKLNEAHVSRLEKQMNNGQWIFDGQPIRISPSGSVLDG